MHYCYVTVTLRLRYCYRSVAPNGADFAAALEIVRARLLESLRKVGIFAGLETDKLMLLRDAMVDAPYDPGDMVFEQARRRARTRGSPGAEACTRR